jgi:ABC-type lipopolysaccharide export system ATPase subunit
MIHTLEVDSVILEFTDKRVLQDVYVKCETNSVTGLLGRNGAGKSCLMNIIYGKLKPLNGIVRIDKVALLEPSRRPGDLMFLPQFGFIPKFLTIKRIFKDFRLDFSTFSDQFPEFKKHYRSCIDELSGGERRIIEIYLILSSKTKFCLLDEPFSHIMPLHVDRIKKMILKEKINKGILITDHLYSHIMEICDDIYLIKDGKAHLIGQEKDIELLGYAKISAAESNS